MRLFRWLSPGGIPDCYDLRTCGWKLEQRPGLARAVPALAQFGNIPPARWIGILAMANEARRHSIMLLGVRSAAERARMLRLGFGEVVGEAIALPELEARAMRLGEAMAMLPPRRTIGPLMLDLMAREAFLDDRPLALHPREFELLWRLGEEAGGAVSRSALLRDVWRLEFVPETNSLAVHVSRLRSKLEAVGLGAMVETVPGGYAVRPAFENSRESAVPLSRAGDPGDHLISAPIVREGRRID